MTQDAQHAYGWSSHRESDGNRLKGIERYKLTVSAAEADIWFKVVVQRVTPGTGVRGRIVGPRCLYGETAEVVWPLRSARHKEEGQAALIARTAIANPGFWHPDNPLLYRVVIELWQDGQRCEVAGFDVGFRMIEMGSGHVFVNKQPLLLQGMADLPQSRDDAAARRRAGYNLVLAGKGQWHWWVRANPMGFLLLERVALSMLTPPYIGLLSQQPCCWGFVLDKEMLDRSPCETETVLRLCQERGEFIGLELDGSASPSLPNGLSFLVCPESVLPAVGTTSLPKLLLRESKRGREGPPAGVIPGVLGWIDQ